jgi:ArsR family transcriptional regulator, arsenate/arsenite/antimonite-responsive transcriptional repressor
MATTRKMAELERLFQALGDATRLRILGLLLTGEICVCNIHETLKIPQPKASRHLAYLRRAGLVHTRREGLWVHYRLADVADPILSAIAVAVRHALTHVDVVRNDAARLQKKTGCCLPTRDAIAGLPCCAPVTGGRAAH